MSESTMSSAMSSVNPKVKVVAKVNNEPTSSIEKSAAEKAREILEQQAAINNGDKSLLNLPTSPSTEPKKRGRKKSTEPKTEDEQSPKAKSSLGIPNDHKITWVPLHLSHEESEMMQNAAKYRNQKVAMMAARMLNDYIHQPDILSSLKEDAAAYDDSRLTKTPAKDMSVEELTIHSQKLQEKLDRLKKEMEEKMSKLGLKEE